MTDPTPTQPPPPRIAETCPCGATIDVTSTAAREIVTDWRTQHAHAATPADRRTGVGFASTQTTTPPRQPWGHINQEIRA